ncbi:mediator of RNA polymerase II transcription subunit 20a isoform X2 [Elaeis guineensis]|uniref:Mediator of RNA polymerase II transcription subunit 20 n=1 Tax=Elaeis guineensis var. tenera TaxID=51953 RepID=A0A8N4IG48_ELAGV|nr:mediator of RNA polymerase II transcription subunit 20a isoform X2 [Elaeis guineensis]
MPNQGVTLTTQILTEACQCVESQLGGAKDGRWKTALTYYRPALREASASGDLPRELLGVALHDQLGSYYFLLRAHRLILQADSSMQALMDKLQSYKPRVVLNFEGFQYRLGDFQVRVGKCVPSSEVLRGIMMEVEYLPLSSIEKSRQILEDFFDIWQDTVKKRSLPGHFILVEPNFADYGLQDHYTPQHTAVQYATCMTQLMAAVRN